MPSFACISSSGTPLVSGTIVFTQTSWRTIMKQKKPKIAEGAKTSTTSAETIIGKTNVREAQKNQWVKLPSAWPDARLRFGKISDMSTQMTVPWPMAWDAMNAKIQSITIFPPNPAALDAVAIVASATFFTSASPD